MTTNHPAHGPVSLDRLHQISEILSKAAAQSDGGNLGYAMADAVKVINGAIAAFGAEPVAYMYKDKLHTDARFSLDTRFGNWSQEDINEYEITEIPLYAAPPAPLVDWVPLGDSPYDVPYSMPSNLRELIAEEIGILFSVDDAQSVWNVCRSAAMLQAGNSPVTPDGSTCKYCGGTGYFRWQQSENMCPCPCVGCDLPAAPQQNERCAKVKYNPLSYGGFNMSKVVKFSMTKEQLKEIAETDHVQCGEAAAMADALLRIFEQSPVAWRYRTNMKNVNNNWMFTDEKWRTKESITFESEPLYVLPLTVSD